MDDRHRRTRRRAHHRRGPAITLHRLQRPRHPDLELLVHVLLQPQRDDLPIREIPRKVNEPASLRPRNVTEELVLARGRCANSVSWLTKLFGATWSAPMA